MKRLLYVDDARSMRQLIELVLGRHYAITLAADGVQGCKALEQADFDLIISDINMPNMDGFEFLKQVRQLERYADTPVLMMTTEADSEMKQRGRTLGASGWIVKPFDPNKLVQTLEKILA